VKESWAGIEVPGYESPEEQAGGNGNAKQATGAGGASSNQYGPDGRFIGGTNRKKRKSPGWHRGRTRGFLKVVTE
jgi:hypothetical protein